VKAVASTTYRRRNDGIVYAVMEYWMNPTAHGILPLPCCLCLATNGSSSANPPAGHCLSYSTIAILAVTESQYHSYATSTVLACYTNVFVHPPLFIADTSNHSKNSASRSWIWIITKKSMQHAGGFGFIIQQVGLAMWISWVVWERMVGSFPAF